MEVIILSGGFGTRLSSVVKDIPKVMAPVGNKPFLEHVLNDIIKYDVSRVVLATGYKKEYIKEKFGDKFGKLELVYSEEEIPLGTGGAIKQALTYCKDNNVIVMNGDVYCKINFDEIYNNHLKSKADVTFALKEMENFDRYGSVLVLENKIISFREKEFVKKGYMSVGCYVFKKNMLDKFENNTKFSVEKEFFSQYANILKFNPYFYSDCFIDIGIPEDYKLVQEVIK